MIILNLKHFLMETIFRSPENKYSFRVINTSNLVILRSEYHSKLHFIWVKDINEDRRSYNNPIIFVIWVNERALLETVCHFQINILH